MANEFVNKALTLFQNIFEDYEIVFKKHLEDIYDDAINHKENMEGEILDFWTKRLAYIIKTSSLSREEKMTELNRKYYNVDQYSYNSTSIVAPMVVRFFLDKLKEKEDVFKIVNKSGIHIKMESFAFSAKIYNYVIVIALNESFMSSSDKFKSNFMICCEEAFNHAIKSSRKEMKNLGKDIPVFVSLILTDDVSKYSRKPTSNTSNEEKPN